MVPEPTASLGTSNKSIISSLNILFGSPSLLRLILIQEVWNVHVDSIVLFLTCH
jgi:hypothetical protein